MLWEGKGTYNAMTKIKSSMQINFFNPVKQKLTFSQVKLQYFQLKPRIEN